MAEASGPKVTILMPTSRADHQSRESSTRLKSLLDEAGRKLAETGVEAKEAKEILGPLNDLVNDGPFWRQQADGLALYAAAGMTLTYRLGVPLTEHVSVGDSMTVRPIAPALAQSHAFYILALSRNKVRLFDATKDSIVELDLGETVPQSMDDVVDPDERQRQLQSRSIGGDRAMFHGHGAGGEVDRIFVEKFVKAVGEGVGTLLGKARSQPLILAAVAEAMPLFKPVCTYPALLDEMVTGNPDDRTPGQLHADAWEVVMPAFAERDDAAYARFADAQGTGRGVTQTDVIREAAAEGRVDTLFINPSLSASEGSGDVDSAILSTLQNSGTIVIISDGRVENVAALMRY